MTGLVHCSEWVLGGPPLSASALSCALTPVMFVPAFIVWLMVAPEVLWIRLKPSELTELSMSGDPAAELPAIMLLLRVTVPPDLRMPPPLAVLAVLLVMVLLVMVSVLTVKMPPPYPPLPV